MLCNKCGAELNEDAMFCSKCGVKIQSEEKIETETKTETKKSILEQDKVLNHIPEAVPVLRPEQEVMREKKEITIESSEVIPVNISIQPLSAEKPKEIEDNLNVISDSVTGYISETKSKDIMILKIFSVIFSVLTIGAAVIEIIDKNSTIASIAVMIEIIIASIAFIIFAFNSSKQISILKGIALLIVMVSDVIFIGFDSIKYAISTFGEKAAKIATANDVAEGLIVTYLIACLVWFVFMYIFFVIDTIRSFAYTRRFKVITLFFGYTSMLAVILQIVLRFFIEIDVKLLLGFLPVNLVYVFLLLSIIFGISSKKKLSTSVDN